MPRSLVIMGCLLVALIALIATPLGVVRAQDGLNADEQAKVDAARRAVEEFFALDTFTIEHTQELKQRIAVSLGEQAIAIDQQIEQQGSTITERQPDNRFDNVSGSLEQVITQTVAGMGQDQSLTLEQTLDMIVVDDQAYLRIASENPEMAGFFPEGWADITEGADAFPGMEFYNMEQLLQMSSAAFSAEIFETLFDAVVAVETLQPATIEGVTVERTLLVLDPAAAFTGENAGALRDMFTTGALPLDVEGLINLIFSDDGTRYDITLFLGADDEVLYGYDVMLIMDIAIPGELVTDPSLAGTEMSLTQESVSTLRFTDRNEPATITAPELEE